MKKYVKCLECGELFKYIIWKHLKQHKLTTKQYKEKYPNACFVSESSLKRMKEFQRNYNPMKGKKNPKRAMLNRLHVGKNHPSYGKPLAEQTKKRISKTKKKLFREGKLKHPWIGRKHTKESKEKNRIKHLRENLLRETLEKMSKSHKGLLSHRKGLKMEQEYGKKRTRLIKQKQAKLKEGMYVGENNPKWKNGVKLDPRGYIFIYKPDHPSNTQGYVQQHRLVIENHLGRCLKPEEEVHHINGIKNDNRIENLLLLKNKSEHRKLHRGEISSNWRGGISFEPYPKIFNGKLKEKIRIKYNRTCQLCGVKESKLNGFFRKLTVHHINYIKGDCRENNLIPLCNRCNAKTSNGNRKDWTKLFGEKIIF